MAENFNEGTDTDDACECLSAGPRGASLFRRVGCDETEGRYANVRVDTCRQCGRLWLRYHVEYEGFSGSGRWGEGLIDADRAAAITPEEAADHLAGLPWHISGGSYFGGGVHRGSGPINWA